MELLTRIPVGGVVVDPLGDVRKRPQRRRPLDRRSRGPEQENEVPQPRIARVVGEREGLPPREEARRRTREPADREGGEQRLGAEHDDARDAQSCERSQDAVQASTASGGVDQRTDLSAIDRFVSRHHVMPRP